MPFCGILDPATAPRKTIRLLWWNMCVGMRRGPHFRSKVRDYLDLFVDLVTPPRRWFRIFMNLCFRRRPTDGASFLCCLIPEFFPSWPQSIKFCVRREIAPRPSLLPIFVLRFAGARHQMRHNWSCKYAAGSAYWAENHSLFSEGDCDVSQAADSLAVIQYSSQQTITYHISYRNRTLFTFSCSPI